MPLSGGRSGSFDGYSGSPKSVGISYYSGGTIPTFTTIAAFKNWYDALPENTPETPYTVKLNVSDLGGSRDTSGSVGNVWGGTSFDIINKNKFVILDLSGSTITSIPNEAFCHCIYLLGVILPNSVTRIGDKAFYYCWNLRYTTSGSITILDGVTEIGDSAFEQCFNFTNITIPNSVTKIGISAFRDCRYLTSVTIGNNVTSIGGGAFVQCTSLTSITIPKNVISIGDEAFAQCPGLTVINVDPTNTKYSSENGVLYNKDKTILVKYPEGRTGTFTIPNSVTKIGDGAFEFCKEFANIIIPDSVTSIGYSAFAYSKLGITGGNRVTSIGDEAFHYCEGQGSIAISDGVTNIGSRVFSYSNLTSVTIGNNVTSIGKEAFYHCIKLTSVTFQSTIAPENFSEDAFSWDGLREEYLAGGIGTYKRASGVWTKL